MFAQLPYPGNDKDGGVAIHGFPNYYTGNLTFCSKDIIVAGAVGKKGLTWERCAISRTPQTNPLFGFGHNWTHNWQWEMVDEGRDSLDRSVIGVYKPSGQTCRFVEISPGVWSSGTCVKDRLVQKGDLFTFQIRSRNIAEVRFIRELTDKGYQYLPTEYTDEQNNTWRFTFSSGYLTQITEPAGRWIKIEYEKLNEQIKNLSHVPFTVISRVSSSDGKEVIYNYRFPAGKVYPILESVKYPDDNKAVYTYAAQCDGKRLLLVKADDPRAGKQLRARIFSYRTEKEAPFGQLRDIRSSIDGSVITSLGLGDNGLRSYKIQKYNGAIIHRSYNAGGKISQIQDGLGFTKTFEYNDGNGLLVKKTDQLGQVTRYEYNDAGDRVKTIFPDGTFKQWRYDSRGRILSKTDESGNSYNLRRDINGRIISVTPPEGGTFEFTYNRFGQIVNMKDPENNWTRFDIDDRGLCTNVIDPMGNITRTEYDEHDYIQKVIDPLGNATVFERNKSGRVVKTIFQDGAVQSRIYDKYGNTIKRIDPLGNEQVTAFDDYGRMILKKDAEGNETRYEYGTIGHDGISMEKPASINFPDNLVTKMVYDFNGRPVAVTRASESSGAKKIRYNYDAKGRKTSVINELGQTVSYSYDARDRLVQKISASGNIMSYDYNTTGLKVKETDGRDHSTRWRYDREGRVVSKTDAKGQSYQKTYYPTGRLATMTDPKGNTYHYEYDTAGRKTALIYPDGSVERWEYNLAGKKETYTNRAGSICTFRYDSRNRLIFSEWSDGEIAESREYDIAGRVTTIDNGISKLVFEYDKNNRLISETQDLSPIVTNSKIDPAPRTVSYRYGVNGKLSGMEYPEGRSLSYRYTPDNQMDEIFVNGEIEPVIRYEYDPAGNLTCVIRRNMIRSEYHYDDDGQVVKILETDPNFATFGIMEYIYDNSGNPQSLIASIGSGSYHNQYKFDAVSQLIGSNHENYVNTTGGLNHFNDVEFRYDEIGNRISVYNNGDPTFYSVNSVNEYTTVGTIAPQYDNNGNLSQINGWSYAYDALNRLIFASNDIVQTHFFYDSKNRVVARHIDGEISLHTYNAWNLIEERNGSDQLTVTYIHGRKTDEIAAMENRHGVFYPLYDALGSVTMITNQDGDIVERYNYSPFGKVRILNSKGEELEESTIGNRWMFSGREWLTGMGLYDYRNRMYSPKLGRFLQTDPIRFGGNDMNLYRYAFNNPVRFTDPYGLEVRVYSSDAFGIAGMNHAFVYDTVSRTGVGRSGNFGEAKRYNGVPKNFDHNIPPWNDPSNYNVVHDLNGFTGEQFIRYVTNHPSMNDGIWIGRINDCHTDLGDGFAGAGVFYPGAPNDRFDLDNWFMDSLNSAWDAFYDSIYDLFQSWFDYDYGGVCVMCSDPLCPCSDP